MPAPHLTKSARKTGSGATKKNFLNGLSWDENHLLIIRQTANYSNLEMVCKPVEEKFVLASAWGDSSYYYTNQASLIAQDANTIANNLRGKMNSLSNNDWNPGHKMILSYYARAGCPGRCKWQPSTVTQTIQ